MNAYTNPADPYQKCLNHAHKVNWDIDTDVIKFRALERQHKFLPDSLSLVRQLTFLTDDQQCFLSQVQGRSYAYIFGLVERFINAKILELSGDHVLGDQTILSALIQFSQEELKHQELFRRTENLAAAVMPEGYVMTANPDDVAQAVLSKSSWAVLALTCHIEIFTQVHYLHSIKDDAGLSPLFKDIFHYHWLEEAQHATLDELEWQRVHASLDDAQIEQGVNDLIDLVVAVDGILQAQSAADARYFCENSGTSLNSEQYDAVAALLLKAYRHQYIVSGVQVERFQRALFDKISDQQQQKILTALTPLIEYVAA
ncbi:MAG: hypothetical protein V7711_17370 [Pseudomonadales bacterium]